MHRALALLITTVAVTATACSSGPASRAPGTPAASAAGTVNVVASTNVYGDIATAIGGDAVTVTSIIDDPEKDPHEYEANAQTQLALAKAQLVIENGAGYDDFMDTMLASAPTTPTLINVAALSGYDQQPATGGFNEHLWYDFPTMTKLATQLSTDLAAAAPAHAATFQANTATFTAELTKLEQAEATIKTQHGGTGVAITEPVPLYLLDAAGLTNQTPAAFSEAIEEDTDVPPAVLQDTLNLFDQKKVALLAYNEQTTGPQTEAVLNAAKTNTIAVVPVTETLPTGDTYLTWMTKNVAAVAAGLSR